jgi:protein tyrosine/serine phosphatase
MQISRFGAAILVLSLPCAAHAADTSAVTISNFHQVDDGLFRSGRPSAAQIAELAPLGVKTILTLETYAVDPDDADEEATAAAAEGITLLRVPMNPLPIFAPTHDQVQQAVDILKDPANRPALVHCYEGADRTGIVVGAYHIEVDGWSPADAISDMRNYGHSVFFYGWDDLLYGFAAE